MNGTVVGDGILLFLQLRSSSFFFFLVPEGIGRWEDGVKKRQVGSVSSGQ